MSRIRCNGELRPYYTKPCGEIREIDETKGKIVLRFFLLVFIEKSREIFFDQLTSTFELSSLMCKECSKKITRMNREISSLVRNENMLLSLRGLANNNNSSNDAQGVSTRAEATEVDTEADNHD